MCINRDKKPATCMCGCSLVCGIVTLAILQGLGLLANLVHLNWLGVGISAFFLLPTVSVLIFKESVTARQIAYIWQWFSMGILLIVLTCWIIAIDGFGLPKMFCAGHEIFADHIDDEDLSALGDDCEKHVRIYMYLGWSAAVVLTVPIQWLFLSIFSEHYEELKGSEAGGSYSQLPNQEV